MNSTLLVYRPARIVETSKLRKDMVLQNNATKEKSKRRIIVNTLKYIALRVQHIVWCLFF